MVLLGSGEEGRSLLNELLALDWVEVPAICDINPEALVCCTGNNKEAWQKKSKRIRERRTGL